MGSRLFRRSSGVPERGAPASQNGASFDALKWKALLSQDPDIAKIADKLQSLGQKWVDEFARLYLSVNDKECLPDIVQTIVATARNELENRLKTSRPVDIEEKSLLADGPY